MFYLEQEIYSNKISSLVWSLFFALKQVPPNKALNKVSFFVTRWFAW
jgi:hypothetical protein